MRKRRCTLMLTSVGLGLLLALASPARADIIYDASATFAFDNYTLGGQLTVDTTTGIVTSSSLTVTAKPLAFPPIPNGFFNNIMSRTTPAPGITQYDIFQSSNPTNEIRLFLPSPLPTPGTIPILGDPSHETFLLIGSFEIGLDLNTPHQLTPESSSIVPEPASITLFALAFVTAGGFHFMRRRRERATESGAAFNETS
jgi:hypothetical protein